MNDGLGVQSANGPMLDDPYVDVDLWRDRPVRDRYVHGGFEATNTRFSI
jgi:hypothetical protein